MTTLSRRFGAVSTAVLLLGIVGCSTDGRAMPSTAASSASVVTDTGIDFSSEDFVVRADGGVAPVGTEVTVTPSEAALPGDWAQFATAAGPAADITLEDGRQPATPISIEFTKVANEKANFVLTETDGEVELLPRIPGQRLATETTHLSTFWPVVFDVNRYGAYAGDAIGTALNISSEPPSCYRGDGVNAAGSARVSKVAGNVLYPCIETNGSDAELSLQSNSGLTWTVATDPQWRPMLPTTFKLSSAVTASAWGNADPALTRGAALLLPEATTILTTDSFVATEVKAVVNPVLSQIRTGALAVDIFVPDQIAKNMTKASCATDLLQSSTGTIAAAVMQSAASCVGSVVGGSAAEVIGIVVDGGGALWTQLEGIVRTASMTDDVTFQVTPTDSTDRVGAEIDRALVEPMLGTWTGPVDQPSSSRDYSTVLTLRHDGRTVVGTVEYPELRCSGTLHGAQMAGDVLKIHETITVNGQCVEEVDLELRMDGDKLAYRFGSGRGIGTASLSRVR
ncbi:hypothetical protein GCM10023217_19190 [Gordonia alkaliphila]|uniref:Lipoprotein n=1 Tax=Gordonia alkaliphila TaxID=1053547 RepID=A0ABP8Z888_9ACTN